MTETKEVEKKLESLSVESKEDGKEKVRVS
jgi:hypothetical protein